MGIKELDNFQIEYIDFYAELPGTKQLDSSDEKRDYIDGINSDITDLHDSSETGSTQGLSDQQVNALAQDQYREAGVKNIDRSSTKDANLFSETL